MQQQTIQGILSHPSTDRGLPSKYWPWSPIQVLTVVSHPSTDRGLPSKYWPWSRLLNIGNRATGSAIESTLWLISIIPKEKCLFFYSVEINNMIDPHEEIQIPAQLTPAAQIRRKYISVYGTSLSSASSTSGTIRGAASKTQLWGKSGPGDTPRSSRSDESEYYL